MTSIPGLVDQMADFGLCPDSFPYECNEADVEKEEAKAFIGYYKGKFDPKTPYIGFPVPRSAFGLAPSANGVLVDIPVAALAILHDPNFELSKLKDASASENVNLGTLLDSNPDVFTAPVIDACRSPHQFGELQYGGQYAYSAAIPRPAAAPFLYAAGSLFLLHIYEHPATVFAQATAMSKLLNENPTSPVVHIGDANSILATLVVRGREFSNLFEAYAVDGSELPTDLTAPLHCVMPRAEARDAFAKFFGFPIPSTKTRVAIGRDPRVFFTPHDPRLSLCRFHNSDRTVLLFDDDTDDPLPDNVERRAAMLQLPDEVQALFVDAHPFPGRPGLWYTTTRPASYDQLERYMRVTVCHADGTSTVYGTSDRHHLVVLEPDDVKCLVTSQGSLFVGPVTTIMDSSNSLPFPVVSCRVPPAQGWVERYLASNRMDLDDPVVVAEHNFYATGVPHVIEYVRHPPERRAVLEDRYVDAWYGLAQPRETFHIVIFRHPEDMVDEVVEFVLSKVLPIFHANDAIHLPDNTQVFYIQHVAQHLVLAPNAERGQQMWEAMEFFAAQHHWAVAYLADFLRLDTARAMRLQVKAFFGGTVCVSNDNVPHCHAKYVVDLRDNSVQRDSQRDAAWAQLCNSPVSVNVDIVLPDVTDADEEQLRDLLQLDHLDTMRQACRLILRPDQVWTPIDGHANFPLSASPTASLACRVVRCLLQPEVTVPADKAAGPPSPLHVQLDTSNQDPRFDVYRVSSMALIRQFRLPYPALFSPTEIVAAETSTNQEAADLVELFTGLRLSRPVIFIPE